MYQCFLGFRSQLVLWQIAQSAKNRGDSTRGWISQDTRRLCFSPCNKFRQVSHFWEMCGSRVKKKLQWNILFFVNLVFFRCARFLVCELFTGLIFCWQIPACFLVATRGYIFNCSYHTRTAVFLAPNKVLLMWRITMRNFNIAKISTDMLSYCAG